NVPDVHGIITTFDGQLVYFEAHGYGTQHAGGRLFRATLSFRAAAEPYRWLNTALAALEGQFAVEDGRDVAHCAVVEIASGILGPP
ncbi:MAG TPA: hypothetical protein VMJ92_04015, partial [Candidatus Limnocylindrales bacterium]|nr:hypothetical protein [Candidatus Limnocylindrales bacterium]